MIYQKIHKKQVGHMAPDSQGANTSEDDSSGLLTISEIMMFLHSFDLPVKLSARSITVVDCMARIKESNKRIDPISDWANPVRNLPGNCSVKSKRLVHCSTARNNER